MSFQLLPGEPLEDGIRRIALKHIDNALAQLTNPLFDRDNAVHDARKTCKRLRAILRLVRDEVGYAFYRKENIRFRDASRLLAPSRDSAVMVETLDKLVQFFVESQNENISSNGNNTAVYTPPHFLPTSYFNPLRDKLVQRHQAHSRRVLETDAIPNFITTLRTAQLNVSRWPIDQEGFNAIAPGLHRVYRRGRQRMAIGQKEKTAETLHDWRKRVKYLWHQLELIEPIWPSLLSETAESLHTLSSYLGDEHDLAELKSLILSEPHLLADEGKKKILLEMIAHRRQIYQANAWPLGQRLYAETPSTFVQRLRIYWHTWRKEKPVRSKKQTALPAHQLTTATPQTELLTTRQAAENLQKSPVEIRRLIRIGRLPAFKLGQKWMILPKQLGEQEMQFVCTRQAAAQLGIPTRQVRKLIQQGQLSASKIGRVWAINADALKALQQIGDK